MNVCDLLRSRLAVRCASEEVRKAELVTISLGPAPGASYCDKKTVLYMLCGIKAKRNQTRSRTTPPAKAPRRPTKAGLRQSGRPLGSPRAPPQPAPVTPTAAPPPAGESHPGPAPRNPHRPESIKHHCICVTQTA